MFSPETITKIGALTEGAINAVQAEIGAGTTLVAVPEGVGLKSLETFAAGRYRYRGQFSTVAVADFGRYVSDRAEIGALVGIDPKELTATAVLNLGTVELPGHADSLAVLKIEKSAAYAALLQIDGRKLSQQDAAEWLEDWVANIPHCLPADDAEPVIGTKLAIAAIRRITIEAARTVESDESQLRAQRSALEKIEASSKAGAIPSYVVFRCSPALGFASRDFVLRLSVVTSDKPMIVLRVAQLEAVRESIGNEFRELVAGVVGDKVDVVLGGFKG